MDWQRMLAYITGSVDEELLLRNEYLVEGFGGRSFPVKDSYPPQWPGSLDAMQTGAPQWRVIAPRRARAETRGVRAQ